MATKEIDQIINLKPMYDYDINEVDEIEIIKNEIKEIIDLLGGGYGILISAGKRDQSIYTVKLLSDNLNLKEDIEIENKIIEQLLFPGKTYQIKKDFSDFNQIFGKIITPPNNANRILCLPIILKHVTTEHNMGEIIFLYNQELLKEENHRLLETSIDRLLLRIGQSFTRDRMCRKVRQLNTLIDIGKSIETVKDIEDLLYTVMNHGLEKFDEIFDHKVHVILRIREGDDLTAIHLPESLKFVPDTFKTDSILFNKVIVQKKSQIIEDFQNSSSIEELFQEHRDNEEFFHFLKKIKSLMLIPIVIKSKVRGIYILYSQDRVFRSPEKIFFDDLAVITAIAFHGLEEYQNISEKLSDKRKKLNIYNTYDKFIECLAFEKKQSAITRYNFR